MDNHEPRIQSVTQNGRELIADGHPQAEEFARDVEILEDKWRELKDALEERRRRLELSEEARRFLFEAGEDEAWLREQLSALERASADSRPKDEISVNNQLKKLENLRANVDNFGEKKLPSLRTSVDDMKTRDHPNKDEVSAQLERIESVYNQLQKAVADRKRRLEGNLSMYGVLRDIEDLEQWINDRIVTASSHDLGNDFEHVTVYGHYSRCYEYLGSRQLYLIGSSDGVRFRSTDVVHIASLYSNIDATGPLHGLRSRDGGDRQGARCACGGSLPDGDRDRPSGLSADRRVDGPH